MRLFLKEDGRKRRPAWARQTEILDERTDSESGPRGHLPALEQARDDGGAPTQTLNANARTFEPGQIPHA